MKPLGKKLRHIVMMRYFVEGCGKSISTEGKNAFERFGRQLQERFLSPGQAPQYTSCLVLCPTGVVPMANAQMLVEKTTFPESSIETHRELALSKENPNSRAALDIIMEKAGNTDLIVVLMEADMLESLPTRFGKDALAVKFERFQYGYGGGCIIDCQTKEMEKLMY